jgi:hypothetical protein
MRSLNLEDSGRDNRNRTIKKSKFTESQIVAILKEVDAGLRGRRRVPQARHQPTDLLQL